MAKKRGRAVLGTVVLLAVISREGKPLSLKTVASPNRLLSDAAKQAVKQWRYTPTLLNGEPVEVVTTITVNFRLMD